MAEAEGNNATVALRDSGEEGYSLCGVKGSVLLSRFSLSVPDPASRSFCLLYMKPVDWRAHP